MRYKRKKQRKPKRLAPVQGTTRFYSEGEIRQIAKEIVYGLQSKGMRVRHYKRLAQYILDFVDEIIITG